MADRRQFDSVEDFSHQIEFEGHEDYVNIDPDKLEKT